MRDLDDWQRRVFGVKEAPPEKPATGIPTIEVTCSVCEYSNAVMAGFAELFYVEHIAPDRHVMRAAPR